MTIRRIQPGPRMSQAVVHGGTVYLAGQVALDAMDGDAAAQTRAILARADALLAEAGSARDRILSATIWLADMADFAAMNAVWDAWLPAEAAPARATVEARLALPEFRVEIALVAAV
ncbi:RidA family protein [Sphingomonas bacterium]|uniref:RidA family protein n=1 Tax=Sphingomonas bacterium TaxID=1895847 RepID=UPI001575CA8B|nr:RidA family protein [Sphingomonas bacterium]